MGTVYTRLAVICEMPSHNNKIMLKCKCLCGVVKVIQKGNLTTGDTKSCGCLRLANTLQRSTKHNHAHTGAISPEYHSWYNAKTRCYNAKIKAYSNYGGRGISMCASWRRSFTKFLSDMGKRPPHTSLDRKDNDGNYTPGNCRWATRQVQRLNQRLALRQK